MSNVPISRVQFANAASTSCAYTSNNTAGNLLVCTARAGYQGTPVVSDSNGNTWQQAVFYDPQGSPSYNGIIIWYAMNCNAGANTVSVTYSASQMEIAEYSGIALTNALGPTNSNGATSGTAFNSGSVTTTQPYALLIGAVANNTQNSQTVTAKGGFTAQTTVSGNGQLADAILAMEGTATYSGTLTTSSIWNCAVAVFYAAWQPTTVTQQIDNFAGASLSGNWSVKVGSITVSSGVTSTGNTGHNDALWVGSTYPRNQWCSVTVAPSWNGNSYIDLSLNSTAYNSSYGVFDGYALHAQGTSFTVYRNSSATATTGTCTTISAGDVWILSNFFGVVTVWQNGNLLASYTDSSPITNLGISMGAYNTSEPEPMYTNFTAGTWSGAQVVQTKGAQITTGSGASPWSVAYSFNVNAGDLLTMSIQDTGASGTFSVTDTLGNNWVTVPNTSESTGIPGGMWYAIASSSGANTVSFNFTGGTLNNAGQMMLSEFEGVNALDIAEHNYQGYTTGPNSSTLTTRSVGVVIGTVILNYDTVASITSRWLYAGSATSGYGDMYLYYLLAPATGSQTLSFNWSGDAYSLGIMANFYQSGSAFLLLGVE